MKESSLLRFIKAYHNDRLVRVNIHTKDGNVYELNSLKINSRAFCGAGGNEILFTEISHAEITAI
ncbi:MAG: hypothetical protein A2096_06215 [Spirochaetes bacterium GWF1_41_5]|nr:MAG: hypothetical protein A2096_06215 [Spirochaetes bacterium GWF1_41_5]HBE04455.1 hypothetical protein [Spirochaetia bacterium]